MNNLLAPAVSDDPQVTSVTPGAPPLPPTPELSPLLRRAKADHREAVRNVGWFAADLRELQDAGEHTARGFANFGDFAESEFPGLTATHAKQLSREGAVILGLERHELVSRDGEGSRPLPGSTGLRELSKVLNDHDEKAMVAVFEKAADEQNVSGRTVQDALKALYPPPDTSSEPPQSDESDQSDPPAVKDQEDEEAVDKVPYEYGPADHRRAEWLQKLITVECEHMQEAEALPVSHPELGDDAAFEWAARTAELVPDDRVDEWVEGLRSLAVEHHTFLNVASRLQTMRAKADREVKPPEDDGRM
jgi:hypothetical protein